MADSAPKWPLDPDVIWQHFVRWFILQQTANSHSCVGAMTSFSNTLLKIAMSHALSEQRVRTLTEIIDDVPPIRNCSGTFPHRPHLSINLILYIAMTHTGCGLKLCTVIKIAMTYSGMFKQISPHHLGHVWAGTPSSGMFGHVPPHTPQPPV